MGKTKDLGHLAHIVTYDASNNITLPANLTVNGTITGYATTASLSSYATQSYVSTQISNLVASAPATLDTLNELATALGNDPNFATTIATSIGTKVPSTRTITINGTAYDLSADRSWNITSMIYPAAGIPLSTGTAWGTSITNNSANWNTAYGWGNHATAGYLTGITSTQVTTALGYTPVTNTRTITINGTTYDLSADRSWTVSGTDSTKLPLAGGTMTGLLAFSNVVGNKIDFYHTTTGSGDRYGVQVQSSELRIHSGAAGDSSGGITFGKSTTTSFTEHLRIRNDGIIQAVSYLRTAGVTSNTVYFNSGTASVDFGNAFGQGTTNRSVYFRGNTGVSAWWGGVDGNGNNIPFGAIDATAGEFTFWRNSGGTGGGTWTNIMTMNASGLTMNSGNFIGNVTGNVSGYSTSVYIGNSSSKLIADSVWAGAGGYPGYQFTGGNSRFGFSSTSGYIDVYTDGNFYAGIDLNGSNNLVWHAGNMNAPNRSGTSYYQVDTWLQCNGYHGLYAPSWNNAHFYPNDASYGSWRILGTRNGWAGLHFGGGNGMTLMMNETEFGFHREGYGWYARFTSGTGHFSISGTAANTSSVSSAVGGSYTWTGIQYFLTNNGTSAVNNSNTAALQAYSTGNNTAFMSFHRAGYYAVNFGLDADNWMRIGGWSAAANRWQLNTVSGDMVVNGDVTAFSDERVKENIETIDNALEKVLSLRGVFYTRNDQDDKKRKVGVIAQETLPILPEVVNTDPSGMYNVAYGNMGGLFIEAFKEQQKKIEAQGEIIEELKRIINGITK